VTASFGVAAVDPAAGFDAARERADRALYEAKRLGRDRVESHEPA
jgi:PleD family two-component response regulator